MSQFASNTSVSSEKSRAEIERTLTRYGAGQFMYGWDQDRAIVGFSMADRQIKFILKMPDRDAKEFWFTPNKNQKRSPDQAAKEYEQAVRQKWRALNLVIKAKLEAVESGITEFDDEFLAHIVLPNGSTTGDFIKPQIVAAYETGNMPELLPDYSK